MGLRGNDRKHNWVITSKPSENCDFVLKTVQTLASHLPLSINLACDWVTRVVVSEVEKKVELVRVKMPN